MAQSKPDLISRQELLGLIRDQAAKVKDDDPRQHAVLAYWQTVVEALPAVDAVPVVRCGECKYFLPHLIVDTDRGDCACYGVGTLRTKSKTDYCSKGRRENDNGTE